MAVTQQVGAWEVFQRFESDVLQLGRVGGLLSWDEQVNMPPRGASARGEAKATLAGLLHERVCDERFGEAISELAGDDSLGPLERARVREGKRERDRAVRVPPALVRAIALAESAGFEAWQAARASSEFSLFRDPLEHILSLRREEADAVGYGDGERYDALLDQYEPEMRVARLEPLLHGLRDELVPLAREIAAQPRPDDAFVHRTYPAPIQRAVGARLAAEIGFDFQAGRLDEAAHPFAAGFAPGDVRLTTREHEDDLFSGLFAVLHEAGHGLYEQGLTGAIEGTFCGNATSLGLHESQSRFWENLVGRSHAFWERHLPELRDAFPAQLADVSLEQFVRAANLVEPSLIRVEADEVTYHLHVFLRFELELALVRGELGVDDLPAAWNERMRTLVGIEVPNDALGVLQDVHWSEGLVGYFPTYTLGTLYSAQFLEAIERELGPIDAIVRAGEYDRLLGWMRERVHSRGALVPPEQIAIDATGEPPGHAALMRYLRAKYGALYDLAG
ncbi:MAG: carboxypeptidase Taq [Gaiellales bacterium]|nr:carboxypeptidase Taq [Gaiellales bacterium]